MDLAKHFKLHYWPSLVFGSFIIAFIISYLISVSNGHVYAIFPYVSDTGAKVPESCIFGQFMNISAAFLGVTLYIRYRHLDMLIDKNAIAVDKKWNNAAFYFAVPFVISTSFVGNFQVTSVFWAHMLAANVTFSCGFSYFVVQTIISRKILSGNTLPPGLTRRDLTIRNVITAILCISYILVGVSGVIAMLKFNGEDFTKWTSDHNGYYEHLVSAFSEWIFLIAMLSYVLTFINEFKTLSFVNIVFVEKGNNLTSESGK